MKCLILLLASRFVNNLRTSFNRLHSQPSGGCPKKYHLSDVSWLWDTRRGMRKGVTTNFSFVSICQ